MTKQEKVKQAKILLTGGSEECGFCHHMRWAIHDSMKANGPPMTYYTKYCSVKGDLNHKGYCSQLHLGRDQWSESYYHDKY